MRLLAFSDLHRDLSMARALVDKARAADVVVGAGDFAVVHEGLEETLAELRASGKPTVLVPGNNETEDALREACSDWPAATVLHGESASVAGTTFFGLGGGVPTTPWSWSFDLSDEEAESKLAAWDGEGVLVVHSPPYGHADGTAGKHLGSRAILSAIERHQPPLAVCGHVHECWAQESRIGATRVVNLGPGGALFEMPGP